MEITEVLAAFTDRVAKWQMPKQEGPRDGAIGLLAFSGQGGMAESGQKMALRLFFPRKRDGRPVINGILDDSPRLFDRRGRRRWGSGV
jgi:hypothetical protein